VAEASSPLVPGGAAVPDELVLGDDGTLGVASGCPAVSAKQKAAKKGNKLAAKWTKKKGLCTGLPKTARLKATFDTSCDALSGTFKSKGVKRAFTATRSLESFGAPSLTPSLDAARHTTKTLGPAGGDVFARGAGGTRFRLAVPPGALAQQVAITLTPVTSLGGLPLGGGLVGAVDLAPSGLAFAIPATLYVMPAGGVPGGLTAGFGWSGAANAFAISPWWTDPEGRWVAIGVEHFSGYGIGIPGPSQLDALEGALMGLAASQGTASSIVATCLQGPAPCTPAELAAIFVEWYDVIPGPRLSAASDVVARIAAHEALLHWMAAVAAATPFLETAPGSGLLPVSLTSRRTEGLALDFANLHSSMLANTQPACSGPVTDWKDWVRIPEELGTRAAQLHGANPEFATVFGLSADRYCVDLFVHVADFPLAITADTTELLLALRTWIRVGDPGGPPASWELVPVAAALELAYSEGASGPEEVETGASGFETGYTEVTVQRVPGSPLFARVDIQGTELEIQRPELLSDEAVARVGALAFEGNLDDAPAPTLEPEATSEHCVQVGVGPPAGQIVAFALEGPGSLSAASDVTELDVLGGGTGRACVEYTAPDGPVAEDEATRLRASLVFDGETYEDELELHPRWVEITLQADVGAGLEDATNAILWVPDTGPFAIAATVTGPGATEEGPPEPVAGANLDADAQDALLSLTGSGGTETLALTTGAAGKAGFALTGDDGETTHAVELRHDPQGSSEAAGVVLKRLPATLALSLPANVTPGTPVPFEATASEGGEPAAGYHVDLTVTGGSVGTDSGTTNAEGEIQTSATLDPGQTQLTITATLRAVPDGEALDVETVQATVEASGVALLTRTDECVGITGGVPGDPYPLGPYSCEGGGQELDSDVVTPGGGFVLSIFAKGTGVPIGENREGQVYFSLAFRVVDGPVLATFDFDVSGQDAGVVLAGVGGRLACAQVPADAGGCGPGVPAAGAVVLQPGEYAVAGGSFDEGGSFELQVDFSPAPAP